MELTGATVKLVANGTPKGSDELGAQLELLRSNVDAISRIVGSAQPMTRGHTSPQHELASARSHVEQAQAALAKLEQMYAAVLQFGAGTAESNSAPDLDREAAEVRRIDIDGDDSLDWDFHIAVPPPHRSGAVTVMIAAESASGGVPVIVTE